MAKYTPACISMMNIADVEFYDASEFKCDQRLHNILYTDMAIFVFVWMCAAGALFRTFSGAEAGKVLSGRHK